MKLTDNNRYDTVETPEGKVLVRSGDTTLLKKVDAVVFDFDGVLADTRKSYDATVTRVCDLMVRRMTGIRLPWSEVAPSLILKLRRTGLFNNDWDTTYALIMFSIISLPEERARMVTSGSLKDFDRGSDPRSLASPREVRGTTKRVLEIVDAFAPKDAEIGHRAVNVFLKRGSPSSVHESAVKRVQQSLGYPGSPPECLMATVFDETYHGAALYREMYGNEPRYKKGAGLIDREKLLIRKATLERLTQLLGGKRLSIVTGRPFLAAKYTLGGLLEYFDSEASLFIGDADTYPQTMSRLEKFRKPSGESLRYVREALKSGSLLYVGDSAEDWMMVENARTPRGIMMFAGVYGTALNRDEQLNYFSKRNAGLIVRSVGQLPTILESVRN